MAELPFRPQELLIHTIARLLAGCRLIATGSSSPIPGAGALLARAQSGGRMRVNVLGSIRNDFFCDGGVELFDIAAQGRLEAFFLGGGQIDGEANINLVGAGGEYPQTNVRWPGSFGSAYLYYLVPRVILFREEHSRRVLVPKVDFISSAGPKNDGTYRPGGPIGLLPILVLLRPRAPPLHAGERASGPQRRGSARPYRFRFRLPGNGVGNAAP